MQYEFVDPSEWDERSVFANMVCKLLMQKHNGIIDKALEELGPIYDAFEEHVRNVYELINNEIPLFCLYDLKRWGADNFSLTTEEYDEAITQATKACYEYYK